MSVSAFSESEGGVGGLPSSRRLGNDAYRRGDYLASIQYYTSAISHGDGSLHLLYSNRSASHLALGGASHFESALDDANSVILQKPLWSKGHFRRGNALLALARFDEAVLSFDEACSLEPDNDELRSRRDAARAALAEAQQANDSSTQLEVHDGDDDGDGDGDGDNHNSLETNTNGKTSTAKKNALPKSPRSASSNAAAQRLNASPNHQGRSTMFDIASPEMLSRAARLASKEVRKTRSENAPAATAAAGSASPVVEAQIRAWAVHQADAAEARGALDKLVWRCERRITELERALEARTEEVEAAVEMLQIYRDGNVAEFERRLYANASSTLKPTNGSNVPSPQQSPQPKSAMSILTGRSSAAAAPVAAAPAAASPAPATLSTVPLEGIVRHLRGGGAEGNGNESANNANSDDDERQNAAAAAVLANALRNHGAAIVRLPDSVEPETTLGGPLRAMLDADLTSPCFCSLTGHGISVNSRGSRRFVVKGAYPSSFAWPTDRMQKACTAAYSLLDAVGRTVVQLMHGAQSGVSSDASRMVVRLDVDEQTDLDVGGASAENKDESSPSPKKGKLVLRVCRSEDKWHSLKAWRDVLILFGDDKTAGPALAGAEVLAFDYYYE